REPALAKQGVEEGHDETDETDQRQRAKPRQPGERSGLLLQRATGFPDQPGGTEQTIADGQRYAREETEPGQPIPPTTRVGTARDRNALPQGAERDALGKSGPRRTAGEGPIP